MLTDSVMTAPRHMNGRKDPQPDHSADGGMLLEILNGLDAAVTCYDRDDRLVFWNAAAEVYFPRATHSLKLGVTLAERMAACDAAGYRPNRISFEAAAPALDAQELHLPDGRRLIARRMRLSLDRHVFAFFDVTDRFAEERKLRQALEDERRRYELVIEGNRDGIYDRDIGRDLIWMSPRAHEMLGLPDGALNGDRSTYVALIHPDDLAAYEASIAELRDRREPIISTLARVRHSDGAWRWIATRGRLVYADDGTPVRSIGSMSDVTAQKEAADALKASEERYAQLIDGTREGIYDMNFREKRYWASPRLHEMLGLSDSVLNGSTFGFLDYVHPDDALALRERIELFHSRNDRYSDHLFRARHADGTWRWLRTRGRITYDDAGNALRSVGSVGDITEEHEAREQLRLAKADLEAKVAERTAHLEREIAERRQADDAARHSEKRLEDAINALEDSFSLYDRDDRLVLCNRSFRERAATLYDGDPLGLTYGELLERLWDDDRVRPTGRLRVEWIAERLRQQRAADGTPYEVRRKDGVFRTRAFRTRTGETVRVTGNITELREAESRLTTAVDAISDSFALFDAQHRLVRCNSAYRRELGTVAETLVYGMSFREICSLCWDAGMIGSSEPKDLWLDRRMRQQEQADGKPFEVRRADKMLRVAEYRTGQGEFVRVGTDVTELRCAEDEQRRLAAENLRLSEAEIARRNFLLQAVIDTIPDGLVIVSETQGAVFWNQGFLRIAGLAKAIDSNVAGPLRSKGVGELLNLIGLDSATVSDLSSRGIQDLKHTCRDGRSLEIRLLPSGEGSRLLWIADTTERREEEAERMALKERMLQSQKSEAIGAIAGTIAHDFNNLLTITLGFAALGQAQLEVLEALPRRLEHSDPAVQRAISHIAGAAGSLGKSLGNIINAADRGKVIVDNLIHFARGRPAALAIGDLTRTLDGSAGLIATSLPSSVAFSVQKPGRALPVRHDPVKIEQVLLNLCINASHAMDGRAGSIRIECEQLLTDGGRASALSAQHVGSPAKAGLSSVDTHGWAHRWRGILPKGSYVRVNVVDDGSGMTPEVLERIFDPFFTTKSAGKGTGLGVPSVDQIVTEHGGAIHIRSKPGAGTVFSVLLPMAEEGPALLPRRTAAAAEPVTPAGEAKVTPPAEVKASPAARDRLRVMVVDDEEHLTELAEMALRRAGYVVDVFTDPIAALAHFEADPTRFSFVLTDQTMPGMTGTALATRIVERRPDLPVLLCTGFSAQAIDANLLPKGVIGVLRKPFAPKELVQIVASKVRKPN